MPPKVITIQVPFLFDCPPRSARPRLLLEILARAAQEIESLTMIPVELVVRFNLAGPWVVPVVGEETWHWLGWLNWLPRMIALEGWDRERVAELLRRFPESILCARVPMESNVLELVREGARVVHLTADDHGRRNGRLVMDLIRQAHQRLVDAGAREEVTLIGSGGIVMAEHVPKAIICGLDAVALDTALWVALQARFAGECRDPETALVSFPRLDSAWGIQRLKDLAASWRDQLLEVLGAMGLREVRRLRGELGRCMWQAELEREAFAEVAGYCADA